VCFGGLFLEERTDDDGGALPAREYLSAGEFEGGFSACEPVSARRLVSARA
jgi:hypothetical protein